jgi:hypothetical protein
MGVEDREQVICECGGIDFTASKGQNEGMEDTVYLMCKRCMKELEYTLE